MGSTENALKTRVMRRLLERGIPCWKSWGGGYASSGIPDVLGCLPPKGRLLAVELKAPGKYKYVNGEIHEHEWTISASSDNVRCKLCGCTPLQLKRIVQIATAGGLAFSADSWEYVEKRLNDEGVVRVSAVANATY